MSREGIDHALTRLRDERDRIAAALLDLDSDQAYELLKGTELTGVTRERRDAIQADAAVLWELFEAFRRHLDLAGSVRAEQARPNTERLARLTELLSGPSVELTGRRIPLEKRTLLGPATEHLTLNALVARMTGLYERVTDAVSAVDAVWSPLLDRLSEVQQAHADVAALAGTLELDDPGLTTLAGRLDAAKAAVVSDPLSASARDLDDVAAALAPLRRRLDDAVRMRGEHADRLRRIEESVHLVAAAESAARAAREVVLVKIADPGLPDEPAATARLTAGLAALGPLREQGRWPELAAAAAGLAGEAETALQAAREAETLLTGLLDRREELRGRLGAYRAKAGRLGRSEDLELGRLYEQARTLLWTAPCDLRQATAVLAAYGRAISSTPPTPADTPHHRPDGAPR